MKIVTLLILSFLILSCKSDKEIDSNLIKECSINDIEKRILQLNEVKEKIKVIDSISNKKRGVSFTVDSTIVNNEVKYTFNVGYNNSHRFENYYTFYVEKNNCSSIKVYDKEKAIIVNVKDWNEINDNTVDESLLILESPVNKIKLPFDFAIYRNDYFEENFEEEYPTYQPSQKLIKYLIDKNYEGESYESLIISSKNNNLNFILSITRADSKYYFLITAKSNRIVNFKKLISLESGNQKISFKITEDLIIERYKEELKKMQLFEKYKILENGKIEEVK